MCAICLELGDAINHLIDSVRRQNELRFIQVRHEEAGALAASARAKLSGRLASCTGTAGPGAVHLLNGLHDAKRDHAPVSVLILGSVVTFGPALGELYALVGALAGASVVFFIDRLIGRGPVDRILGERVERAEELFGRHGVVSVAVARNIPVAPYSVVNLIAGASPLRFRDYFFGTLLGFLPTLIALAVVGDRIAGFVENPDQASLLSLAGLIAVVAVVAVLAGRWLVKRHSR